MSPLRLILPLALLSACDDHEFKPHGEAIEGEGLSAVLDVMDGNCAGCHGGEAASAGLDLSRDGFCDVVLDGRLVIPGDAANSVLQQRIEGDPSPMPPTSLMDAANIDIVREWIDDGADCLSDGGGDDGGDDSTGDDGGGDDSAGDDGSAIDGEQIYASSCGGCHGAGGEGGFGPAMGSIVPSFSEAEIADICLNGSASGNMAAVLSDADEADAVAAYCVDTWGV